MDNEDRSKDVKDKMATCAEKTGRFLAKAPYGYKNITVKKGHKTIEIDSFQARIVRDIFKFRIEGHAYSMIALLISKKYGKNVGLVLRPSSIQKVIVRKFYY